MSPKKLNNKQRIKPPGFNPIQAWNELADFALDMYAYYLERIKLSFSNLPRDRQEQWVTNASQIICVGLTALVLSYFYKYFPLFARVAIVPMAIIGAWWVGTNIIPKKL